MGMLHNTDSDIAPGVVLGRFLRARTLIENYPNLTDVDLAPIVFLEHPEVCAAAEAETGVAALRLIGILRARINHCGGTRVPRVRPLDWRPRA